MGRLLIGQVLRRMGKVDDIDVQEILSQQERTRQKFGEIALSWGLCDPDNLCEAWCAQLAGGVERVDLQQTGIDSHATHAVPREMAQRLGVIPIRSIADQVIVAAGRALEDGELAELLSAAGKNVRIVLAESRQIEAAIERYYPSRGWDAA